MGYKSVNGSKLQMEKFRLDPTDGGIYTAYLPNRFSQKQIYFPDEADGEGFGFAKN